MSKNNLHNINKTGFKIPDNYFDSVEDQLMDKINSEQLDDNKITGFKTPDDYFDSVEDNVFKQLNKDNKTKVVALFSRKNLMYLSGVAAAVLIMLSIFIKDKGETIFDLDSEMVEAYFLEQDISSYELLALLTEEELYNINFEILNEVFKNETIEDYLLDNIEIEDILEQ